MTNDEIKDAVKRKSPILYDGKEYEYIEEIIYYYRGGWRVSALLHEKGTNAVYRVKAEDVHPVGR